MRWLLEAGLAATAIIASAQVLGHALTHIGQPRVIGQILAGVVLGPTFLGLLGAGAPVDPRAASTIEWAGTLGLVVFMLVVGLELDLRAVLARRRSVAAIATTSVVAPFACGAALALMLHARHATVDGTAVALVPFVLFLGTAFAVTSFPVLAAVVKERGLLRTPLGGLALATAATGDVVAWTLLAAALGAAHATGLASLLSIGGQAALFLLVVRYAVRPLLLAPIVERARRRGSASVTDGLIVCAIAVAAAATTDAIGLHAVFGAFAIGVAVPRGTLAAATGLAGSLRVPVALLAPLAFAIPGLALDLDLLARGDLVELVIVVVVASGSKLLGVAAVARHRGIAARDAWALGVLVNMRGLVEVVVLIAGRAAGLLDDRLFAILLTMALVTTVAASPLLRIALRPRSVRAGASAPALR